MPPHLVVVHYHLRPGGVRRVIELALPAIVQKLQPRKVTIAVGEAAEPGWLQRLGKSLPGIELCVRVEAAFGYTSERRTQVKRLRALAADLLSDAGAVWFHNPALGRNLPLVDAVTAAAREREIPLVFHHHDLWFENRWARQAEFRALGYRTLDSVARTIFPADVAHVAINRFDHRVLRAAFGPRAIWMPNLASCEPPPPAARVRAARRWLREKLGDDSPVWIFPTRLLRRKNLAEAVLITRWLRPEAWMITTAAPSSPAEIAYGERLVEAAKKHGWRARFSIRAEHGSTAPGMAELVAAAEVVLLTSIQEGFGLPYIEAAEAGKPLIARALPNVLPDLRHFGFRLPHIYDEVWIDPRCFDQPAEHSRQLAIWQDWRRQLPASVKKIAEPSAFLGGANEPVPFSRLSLAAQIEVLSLSANQSWAMCSALNPLLSRWKRGPLKAAEWPKSATSQIGPAIYARRFARALRVARSGAIRESAAAAQRTFIAQRVSSGFMFPILMEEA